MSVDAAIIGGGIVGAACALRLSQEGLKVLVLEANEIAGGTTAAGMGHVVVMDDSDAQFALTDYSRKLWAKLSSDLPENCEFETCGTIWVASDIEELRAAEQKQNYYLSRGIAAEMLDEKTLSDAEPNLRNGLPGGLFIPGDSVVYQLTATKHFLELAQDHGARILTGSRAVAILENGVQLQSGELILADKVVNACGVLAPNLIEGLEITKKKGHLAITERYPGFVNHQLVELGYLKSAHSNDTDSVAFNVQPRQTDQMLIGSSRQFGKNDKAIDYGILGKMLKRACEYMPNLERVSTVRVWTGFRPATPDNLPYIGRHATKTNTFIAAGHEGLGITTSLGTAEILTDDILGRNSQIDRAPYSPARFSKECV